MRNLSLITLFVLVLTVAAFGQTVERTHDIVPEDYFTQVFLSDVDVSPDGKLTAFVDYRWDEEYDRRSRDLWVVDNTTKETLRLTFDPRNEVNPQWTPDSKQLYFVGHYKLANATEPPYDGSAQVWRINADGTELTPITRIPDGIYDFQLSADGKTIYYTRTKEHLIDEWKSLRSQYKNSLVFGHGIYEVSELWKLSLVDWRSDLLLDPTLHIHEFAVSPDESQIVMITTVDGESVTGEGWSNVRMLTTKTGEFTLLPDKIFREDAHCPHGWLGGLTWTDDGARFAFTVDFDGYPSEILVADVSGGAKNVKMKQLIRPDEASCSGGLSWQPGTHNLGFKADLRARQRVCVINTDDGSSKTLTPGDVVIDGYSFIGNKGALLAIQSTTTYYQDLIYWDRKGKQERLTHLNPQVDTWKLPQISIFSWIGADGDTVQGKLELPPDYDGEGNLPLLVSLHGGPTDADRYSFLLWMYGHAAYAAKGYAMLAPNYRGSTGYGDDFLTDLIGHENNWDVIDIMTGVDALIEQGIVDPERMGVTGWSNGGFLTNCLIASNRFKAASSGAGVLDMAVQVLEEDTPGHVINYMEGLPWEKPEEYQAASPLYGFHDGITTNVLIHCGENDPRVPVTHAKGLHRMLTRYLGVNCELVIYPGAGHNLTKYSQRLAKVRWDHAWFDKYVLGEE